MEVDAQTVEARVQRFLKACRDANYKVTPQRSEIFKEVAKSVEHPDAESIFRGVRERLPTTSLDTVYRTLWWLAGLGLVKTMGPTQERTRFDANMEHHHHFVCLQCGLTRDFHSEELDALQLPEAVAVFGSIEWTQVEVKGICRKCARERKAEAAGQDA